MSRTLPMLVGKRGLVLQLHGSGASGQFLSSKSEIKKKSGCEVHREFSRYHHSKNDANAMAGTQTLPKIYCLN